MAEQYAAVAQLDRVFGYEPKGRGFESLQPYQKCARRTLAPDLYVIGCLFVLALPASY